MDGSEGLVTLFLIREMASVDSILFTRKEKKNKNISQKTHYIEDPKRIQYQKISCSFQKSHKLITIPFGWLFILL